MTQVGSSVPRRQLGRYLRRARDESGISLEAAAREMEWSRAKMYRIEGGQAPMRRHEVLALCALYGAPPDLTEALVGLAAETKAKGWWHSYGETVPDWFELYVSMEAAAAQLRQYQPSLIPGLLQTPEYAAAVFRTRPGATESDVAQAVSLRMERQNLLARRKPKPPTLEVIIDEAVLRRPITDREGMRKQLAHLVAVTKQPRIDVRVLPSSVGPHRASVAGAFVILDFVGEGARPAEPTTVYSESLTGALYLDKPAEVQAYADAWQELCELALDPIGTEDLVGTITREMLDA